MSTDTDLVDAVKEDFADVEWRDRVQTMLLCVGLIAFGFVFGVGYYATVVQIELPTMFGVQHPDAVAALNARFEWALIGGVGVAAAGLAGVVYIEHWSDRGDDEC